MSARGLAFVLVALVLCVVAAGCGGDEEGKGLPAAQVQLLNSRLDETQRRLDDGSAGACRDVLNDTKPEVGKIIDSLPSDVDADVRDALVDSFDNLWSLVDDRCQEAEQEEESQQEPEQPEDTQPEPTPTETTETETETTPTETTPPATEELPPEGDGDNNGGVPGNGNGNGVGNGGGVGPDGANLGGGE